MTLIQQLVKKGLLEKEKATSLEYEVKNSGKKEEEVILEQRLVSEDFLFGLKSENLKIPFKRIYPEDIPLQILEVIPEDSARYYHVIPVARKDNVLEVGMLDPGNLKAKEALRFITRRSGLNLKIFSISEVDYKNGWSESK